MRTVSDHPKIKKSFSVSEPTTENRIDAAKKARAIRIRLERPMPFRRIIAIFSQK